MEPTRSDDEAASVSPHRQRFVKSHMQSRQLLAKVPEVTLVFWVIKIAATTLGETGGDAVSMSMK